MRGDCILAQMFYHLPEGNRFCTHRSHLESLGPQVASDSQVRLSRLILLSRDTDEDCSGGELVGDVLPLALVGEQRSWDKSDVIKPGFLGSEDTWRFGDPVSRHTMSILLLI